MKITDINQERADIGARLRKARESAGLSQAQVAKMLNVHRPSVSEMEAGNRRVSAEELRQMSNLYDVDIAWLVDGNQKHPSDRYQLAARELEKMKPEDIDRLMTLLSMLKQSGGDK